MSSLIIGYHYIHSPHLFFQSFNQIIHSIKIKIKNNSKITQNQNQFQNNENFIDKNTNTQMSLIYIKIQNVAKIS